MAGVLGNPLGYKNLIRNEEALDVAVEPGYYGLQASITVGSNTETVFGTLLVQSSPNYVIQIATGSAGIALMRRYDVGSSVWNAWTRLDNFGYNSLEELAGGVAEQTFKGTISDDLNNYIKEGSYVTGAALNQPPKYSAWAGFLRVFNIGSAAIQIWFTDTPSTEIFIRVCFNGTWIDWKTIS